MIFIMVQVWIVRRRERFYMLLLLSFKKKSALTLLPMSHIYIPARCVPSSHLYMLDKEALLQ